MPEPNLYASYDLSKFQSVQPTTSGYRTVYNPLYASMANQSLAENKFYSEVSKTFGLSKDAVVPFQVREAIARATITDNQTIRAIGVTVMDPNLVKTVDKLSRSSLELGKEIIQMPVRGLQSVYGDIKSGVGTVYQDVKDTGKLGLQIAGDVASTPGKIVDDAKDFLGGIFGEFKDLLLIGAVLVGAFLFLNPSIVGGIAKGGTSVLLIIAAVALVFLTPGIPDEIILGGLGVAMLAGGK